jgi:hypothetical protein
MLSLMAEPLATKGSDAGRRKKIAAAAEANS